MTPQEQIRKLALEFANWFYESAYVNLIDGFEAAILEGVKLALAEPSEEMSDTATKEKIPEQEATRHEDNCIICWPTPDKDEKDPIALWAEIWRLRDMVKGPTGYETWRDAAVSEKQKRIAAEAQIKALREDAERYRWLRTRINYSDTDIGLATNRTATVLSCRVRCWTHQTGDLVSTTIDDAIDAARKIEGNEV